MIHSHHFYFVDQPVLQEEYESFGFKRKKDGSDVIVVREIKEHNGFRQRNGMTSMSGRNCAYLSDGPLSEIGKHDAWGLEVIDVLSLAWEPASRTILYGKGKLFTPELLRFWIFHTFFPIVLEREQSYKMLHVGGVEVGGGPILFSANSFGGKSTLTNYFVQKGHALFSDDTLAVRKEDEHYIVYPSFPYHRPYRQVESLGVRAENFARSPAPIKAVFELHPSAPDAEVEITPSLGVERFKTLYYSHFIQFRFMKHERSAFALQMAKVVPVYNISVPWDMKRLDEVYEAIVRHTEKGSV